MKFEFEGSMDEFRSLLQGTWTHDASFKKHDVKFQEPAKVETPPVVEKPKIETPTVKESVLEPAWSTAPAVSEPPVKRGRGRPKGSGKKVVETAAAPLPTVDDLLVEEEEEQDDETVEAEVETPATKADLTYALEKLIGSRGVPVAKTLLGEFGVAKLGDLSEKFYGSFLKRAMELGS